MSVPETQTIVRGPITDVTFSKQNRHVIEKLGRYAVDEYNKKALIEQNALLEFRSVVSAKQQLAVAMIYYLTIEAVQDGEKKLYEAKVLVKRWINFQELEDFKPIR